ncbi:ABC transporter permease (plasmid) [Methylomonas sp. MS20]|uniref:ABC transporter permease n=1 Tax=Methylomonas sp. MS20 TaxID=3418769 RepID=UPI003D087266
MGRFIAMLRKEFAQLLGDIPILFILFWAFSGNIYVMGHAITSELRNYPVAVLDLARSPASRELVSRLRAPHFKLVGSVSSDAELVHALDAGKAGVGLVIPPDFDRAIAEGKASFQVISDGTLSRTATIAGSHLARIAQDFNRDILQTRGLIVAGIPQVDARLRVAYNPNISNPWFSSLLEMMNVITMVSMLLTAAAMVREKTYGTLEQLLVSPLRPAELFAAKIIPTVVLVLVFSLMALFGVVQGVFGTPIRGSLLLFYSVTVLYTACVASLGLVIAMLARNIAQVMMLLLLIMYPMLMLSGAITPPESMAPWVQYLSLLSPLRYYFDFSYQVLFKGNGLAYVWHDIFGIVVLGALMFGFAVRRFKRLFA